MQSAGVRTEISEWREEKRANELRTCPCSDSGGRAFCVSVLDRNCASDPHNQTTQRPGSTETGHGRLRLSLRSALLARRAGLPMTLLALRAANARQNLPEGPSVPESLELLAGFVTLI
jgi:hypothetical protein